MEKYRIVQLIHDAGSPNRRIEWVIEQKKFWGWREIFHVESPSWRRISHKSYNKAEQYLFDNYMGHGICTRYGTFYTYEKYRYNYYYLIEYMGGKNKSIRQSKTQCRKN